MQRDLGKELHGANLVVCCAVFAPLATCGVIWASRHIRGSPSRTKEQAQQSSDNESTNCDKRSSSQQPSSSTLSCQPLAAVAILNSNSSPDSSQLSGTPAATAPVSAEELYGDAPSPLQPQLQLRSQDQADPATVDTLGAHSTPPTQCNVAQEISIQMMEINGSVARSCLLYTSPSPRDRQKSRMPSSA